MEHYRDQHVNEHTCHKCLVLHHLGKVRGHRRIRCGPWVRTCPSLYPYLRDITAHIISYLGENSATPRTYGSRARSCQNYLQGRMAGCAELPELSQGLSVR